MIDSGSMACTLSESAESRLLQQNPDMERHSADDIIIIGCGGQSVIPKALYNVELTVYDGRMLIPVLVVPGQTDEMILGSNAIKAPIQFMRKSDGYCQIMSEPSGVGDDDFHRFLSLISSAKKWRGESVSDKVGTLSVTLAHHDFNKPFILAGEVTFDGTGAVLSQVPPELVARPMAFASKMLSRSQLNYPAHKLEFLALKWAIREKFCHWLKGRHFTAWSDINPLTYLLTKPKLDTCEQRWVPKLAAYDFDLKYVTGAKNTVSDALSCETFVSHHLWKEPYTSLLGEVNGISKDVMFQHVLENDRVVSHCELVQHLKRDLSEAARIAQKHALGEQDRHAKLYNCKVRGSPLAVGDRVLLANRGEKGKKKIADKRDSTPFDVTVRRKIIVYRIKDIYTGKKKVVHRNLLFPVDFRILDEQNGSQSFSEVSQSDDGVSDFVLMHSKEDSHARTMVWPMQSTDRHEDSVNQNSTQADNF
ncbi:hypothetical protein SRHO_G00132990 [Serrasalmus rhombeus]